jgi:4-diphosphocytidyl-2-C-methyl-D-erythritol kinase
MSLAAIYDVPAPAKLNLFLHVVGRRPDGYHLLQSVFVLIDWCDTLHFERRCDGLLQRHDLGPALPPDDLSLRAARALQQASGCSLGADLSVYKRVPWGAGLGGGSSDAASTLLALNRLWGLNWPRARLQQIALSLGADVPFFVGGQNAFVEGIGEQLHPLPAGALPLQDYAVVKPAASVATAAIFGSADLARDTKSDTIISFLANAGIRQMLASGYGRNDLQGPAQASCPEISEVADWLDTHFGNSRMSGSGSAVFARVDRQGNDGSIRNLGKSLSKAGSAASWAESIPPVQPVPPIPPGPSGWTGRMCRGLGHHPLAGWVD